MTITAAPMTPARSPVADATMRRCWVARGSERPWINLVDVAPRLADELDGRHPASAQERESLQPILAGSLAFTRAIDHAAAAMYALQHEVLAAQGIPVQGVGREAFRS